MIITDYERFSLDLIDSIEFEADEWNEETTMMTSYKLTNEDMRSMPHNGSVFDLQRRMTEIYMEKFKNYNELASKCDITGDLFGRMMKVKNSKTITFRTLSKFVIGAGLSVEEAEELFELLGQPLNPRCRYDYILICELKNRGDIYDFNDDLIENDLSPIIKNAD